MTDMEMAEISAAKNAVLDVLEEVELPDGFDRISLADAIVERLVKGGVLIPEWYPDPFDNDRPAQGYYPTASQMERWQGRKVTPKLVSGR